MKRPHLYVFLILLAIAGWLSLTIQDRFVVTPDGVTMRSELAKSHLEATKINFDMLDEARPMDLIDISLEFPESLSELDGKRVHLVGFMAPYDSLNDMRKCMMFPTYVGCSFCTPPSLSQVVYVRQRERTNTRYPFIEPPSDVSGTLRLLNAESDHEGHLDGFIYVIDDAMVTPHLGTEAPIPTSGHGGRDDPSAHRAGKLEEISLESLADEVSRLRGLPILRPMRFNRISEAQLLQKVSEDVELAYGEQSHKSMVAVFDLLGFFEELPPDWAWLITSLSINKRVARVEQSGELIEVLNTASTADPFTRLELVKDIAEALARQHFPAAQPPGALHSDSSRAIEGLRQGNRQLVAYRYSRKKSISPASNPPEELSSAILLPLSISPLIEQWYFLPWEIGPFFVEARTGATKELSRIDSLYQSPPRTTRELFRPRLYEGTAGAKVLIPADFADQLLPEAPVLVEQLGLGGLVPWLLTILPHDQAKAAAGSVLDDRYALWNLPKQGYVMLLETRWPDQQTAQVFVENLPSYRHQFVKTSSSAPFSVRVIRAKTDAGLQRLVEQIQ